MSEKILKILVVEDDNVDQLIIKRALKDSGIRHEIIFADDHESGREATRGKEYDCIFLDQNLPRPKSRLSFQVFEPFQIIEKEATM